MKNLSMIDKASSQFHLDLAANKLPQWMFITPNMTSDAHDTDVETAGEWLRSFLDPLLTDPNFMSNTLILVTFDENESYGDRNQVFSIVLGDAVPANLVGTVDSAYYNHYSELSTVEANWDLGTLGRWDVGANIFDFVGQKTGDTIKTWAPDANFGNHYFNLSYAGVFNSKKPNNAIYPAPNLALDGYRGRPIFGPIKDMWQGSQLPTYYTSGIENNDGLNPPAGFAPGK
jgi:hypothetical protein